MPPDIGTSLTIQATRRFTCNPAGYRAVSPIRSPLMVNSDGYCRAMLCPTDMDGKIETWLAPVRKDFSFTGPSGKTNRRARAPLLFTLDPLTLRELIISPTTACNASAGTSTPAGAGWGNMVPLGTFNVLEIGDDIIASYGGDGAGHDCSRFNKYTGVRVPFSTSLPANWSGILSLNPDGTIENWGVADYWTVLQPATAAHTDAAVYAVAAAGSSGYSITRTDLQGGKPTVHAINLAGVGRITDVKTSNGLLFIQSVINSEVVITVLRGDKTPPLTLPKLPASGYVPATPVDMTLATGEEIKPLKIAQPNPAQADSYAKDPVYRHAYLFPVIDGPAFFRATHAYCDQHSVDPADLRLWLFPTTWPEPSTRKNIPMPIGTPIARRNVGKIGSGLVRPDFDVSTAMAAAKARGEKVIAFCLEGVAPPYFEKSKVWLIDKTVLIAATGTVTPPVEPPAPKFEQVIKGSDFGGGGIAVNPVVRSWQGVEPSSAQVFPDDGFNYATADNAKVNAPRIDYTTKELPAGRYEISITAVGPSVTKDSLFVQVDGGSLKQVDSFTPTGSSRVAGVYDLAAGAHVVSLYARECGLIVGSIRIVQQA